MTDIIQGLWIGPRLTAMEQVSIASFLANGHPYHLYTYGAVEGVPEGASVRDAAEILPPSQIFQYREQKSYAGFANFFRYKLLLERGGWWVDTDVIALRPFIFASEYVFASERDSNGREFVTSGIIKAPKECELMRLAWQTCQSKDTGTLRWGETGPTLMHNSVLKLLLGQYVQNPDVFCPIDPPRWYDVVLPGRPTSFGPETVAVHLWNEFWRRMALDKDEVYAPGCLYEHLKKRYLKQRVQVESWGDAEIDPVQVRANPRDTVPVANS
jgi:hypothetical protein